MKKHFTKKIIILLVLVCFCALDSMVKSAFASEESYKVKAVFLFKFFKYINWPDTAPSRNVVCVYGRNPFGNTLDYILENKLKSSKYSVEYINKTSQIKQCKIMFVSSSSVKDLSSLLGHKGVLTVSDIDGFASEGGVFELREDSNKIDIIINLEESKKIGLKVSSKLLKIAKVIR